MITITREGSQSITLEGNASDFQSLMKSIERAIHPDQTQQTTMRVLDQNGGALNLIFIKGKSRDSL